MKLANSSPIRWVLKKLQNCVKAAIASMCTTCKGQLLFALLQLITFVCLIAIANIFMEQQLLYGLLQVTTFIWTIATDDYCMLQTSNHNVSYIDCNYAHKLMTALWFV